MTGQQIQWAGWAQITSVPLCREDEACDVIAAPSGCLIQYRNRRFLLTVAHAVPGSRWAILLGFDARANLFEVYRLRGFNAVAVTKRQWVNLRELDFCFEEVGPDVDSVFEHRTPMGVFSERRARHVFATDLTTMPRAGQMYAFSGEIKAERHGQNWVSTSVTYPGLRYANCNGELHTFQIPVPHPGHESFKGCSGAPIVGEDQEAVALVDPFERVSGVRGIYDRFPEILANQHSRALRVVEALPDTKDKIKAPSSARRGGRGRGE